MVMDFCPRGDLGSLLRMQRKFTETAARIYICEVILAIEEMHKNEVIFRDLKPENVLVDENGHLNLTDFGIAKFLNPR